MMRVAFLTLGCKVNQAESEAIARELGAEPAGGLADADVVVVNTCTVTGEADRKARKAVRHALSGQARPTVVVTGCLAAVDGAALSALGERVIVEPDKSRVAAAVRRLGAGSAPAGEEAPAGAARHRVQVKVQDGCDAFCSYCIVPYARGLPQAVDPAEVVGRVESLVAAGVAEVVLTGINIGRYDHGGMRLAALVSAVAGTGIERIRLSSIEPGDVDDELLEVAGSTSAFCRHLHVPLQSGCDSVLARMRRPYDTAAFARTVARVREALPGVAVTTDVIAGFPGETDAEWRDTLWFLESQAFSRLHVFRYSERDGTPAASMPGRVPPTLRASRSGEARALGERLTLLHARSMVGRTAEVLVERRAGDGCAEGTTREYLRARVMTDAPPGRTVAVLVEEVDPGGVLLARAART